MSAKKPATEDNKATTVVANDPADQQGTLKRIGGSQSDGWNNVLANQTVNTLWLKHSPMGKSKMLTLEQMMQVGNLGRPRPVGRNAWRPRSNTSLASVHAFLRAGVSYAGAFSAEFRKKT